MMQRMIPLAGRFSNRRFAEKCVPNQEIGNERKATSVLFVPLALSVLFFLSATARAIPATWSVADAPFRVPVKLATPPIHPEAGILISLPEFGQNRPDCADVILSDTLGQPLPLAKVSSRPGGRTLLLAQQLEPTATYYVYFGGGVDRKAPPWTPKVSLLMETKPAPKDLKLDAWADIESAWKKVPDIDGAGFYPIIYHGENLFGQSTNFLTHYTGYLLTPEPKNIFLYTLSADASFVLVNDKLLVGWPGEHSPWVQPKNVKGKTFKCESGLTKIDYYAAKGRRGHPPTMVLGWKLDNGTYQTVPAEAWLHPGTTSVEPIEEIHGWPVPLPKVELISYIGYNDQWLFEAKYSLNLTPPAEWTVNWEFADGVKLTGTSGTRVLLGPVPELVEVKFTRTGDNMLTEPVAGRFRIDFTASAKEASFKNPPDVRRYLALIESDPPGQLNNASVQPRLTFLLEFGTDQEIAKFIDGYPQGERDSSDPLWLRARVAAIYAHAELDPPKALAEMRAISSKVRQLLPDLVNTLESDLLAFYQNDPGASDRLTQIAFLNPDSNLSKTAKVRIGDLYRLLGRYKEAIARYKELGIQGDDRSLPAQDRANSIAVSELLSPNRRDDAQRKLGEWEIRHPMAKFDSDFLLLRARMLMLYGRWSQALTEIESFDKVQPESAYQIDSQFYRARILFEQGRKDEARKLWKGIAQSYPKHPLAGAAREWGAKP